MKATELAETLLMIVQRSQVDFEVEVDLSMDGSPCTLEEFKRCRPNGESEPFPAFRWDKARLEHTGVEKMSKKIVIDLEVLESVLECLKKDIPMSANGWEAEKIDAAMKDQKRFSVLEWHDVKEAPSSNAERVFVEYSSGGFGFVFGHPEIIKDDPDYKRWAYLPDKD